MAIDITTLDELKEHYPEFLKLAIEEAIGPLEAKIAEYAKQLQESVIPEPEPEAPATSEPDSSSERIESLEAEVAALKASKCMLEADSIVGKRLAESELSDISKGRITRQFAGSTPDDLGKFGEAIQAEIAETAGYEKQLAESVRQPGVGFIAPAGTQPIDVRADLRRAAGLPPVEVNK